MNSITSNKNSAILLLTALIAALLFAVYYYVLTPKLDDVKAKESTVSTINQEITSLQEQIAIVEETQQSSTSENLTLRKKVPQTRAIEKVLLDIAEIEAVTGTLVESISFNNYDSLVLDSTITDPNAPVVDEGAVQDVPATGGDGTDNQPTEEETEGTTDELPVSTIAKESLPAALKLVTFSIDIAALDMKSLNSYLEEIEKIERIMKIDALDISLPGEEDKFQEDADPTVTATIQVTTFYYEGEK
ncbi:potassium transporter [Lysinibacillus sp. NPDC097287]|uniref:potassium transporter n=1 Tax=Lysinibacillus sp. NPDC097287 TaxID=3364144 RepID=UPI00381CB145